MDRRAFLGLASAGVSSAAAQVLLPIGPGAPTWPAIAPPIGTIPSSAAASGTPPTIFAQASGSPLATRTTITWQTDVAASSLVEWGLTSGLGSSSSNASAVTSHALNVMGLTPNTLYYWRVTSTNAGGATQSATSTFTTSATAFATGAIVGADPQNAAWLYNGTIYGSEASWLSAVGGVTSSPGYLLGPTPSGELAVNGGFDSDTSWTKTVWTIPGTGYAHKSSNSVGTLSQTVSYGVTGNRVARHKMTIVNNPGGGNIFFGNSAGVLIGSNYISPGTYTEDLTLIAATTVTLRRLVKITDTIA